MKQLCLIWIACLLLAFMPACGGGGSSGTDNNTTDTTGGTDDTGDTGGTTPTTGTSDIIVLAANDLGMHCMDREFSVFSILPPFNVVSAQVIGHETDGSPVVLDDTDTGLTYNATTDALGSINSFSIGKTDFWDYADSLFSISLADGEGLTGRYMPQDAPAPGPQSFDYHVTYGWFTAEGIPITPKDDDLADNPYALMRISAADAASGSSIGHTDIVVPMACTM